jgi:rsbT co-antagonist protein RsbR
MVLSRIEEEVKNRMSKENQKEFTESLYDLLEHNADKLTSQWVLIMQEEGLLAALSPKEIEEDSKLLYSVLIKCLRTGLYDTAEEYAANMAKKGVIGAMTVYVLRDVVGRFIFDQYHKEPEKWKAANEVYDKVARKLLNIVALAFTKEGESIIRAQQTVMSLSIPLVEVWEDIIAVPLVGILDSARAKQLTESVLEHIARAKTDIIILDISGIAALDTSTANYILHATQAVKLMGSEVIITGIRPDVATTLVTLGVDVSGIMTRSTLREGLEYGYTKAGFRLTKSPTT